jgi:hypothetical protein
VLRYRHAAASGKRCTCRMDPAGEPESLALAQVFIVVFGDQEPT